MPLFGLANKNWIKSSFVHANTSNQIKFIDDIYLLLCRSCKRPFQYNYWSYVESNCDVESISSQQLCFFAALYPDHNWLNKVFLRLLNLHSSFTLWLENYTFNWINIFVGINEALICSLQHSYTVQTLNNTQYTMNGRLLFHCILPIYIQ